MSADNSVYIFFSELIFPNGHKHQYNETFMLSFIRNLQCSFAFHISSMKNNRINNAIPQDFDFIMSWLGNALYPLTVRMNDCKHPKFAVFCGYRIVATFAQKRCLH